MNTLFKFEIPKRSMYCFGQEERLLPGMEIYSLLLETETETLVRRDFCSICWTHIQEKNEWQANRGYWKSKIECKKEHTKSSRMERALALLRDLLQASEQNEGEIFVLCLLLSHARQLILRQEFQREGITYHLYEVLRQEEYYTVKALNLSQIQIQQIQKFLASKLPS